MIASTPAPVDVSISMSVHLGDMMRETAHLSVSEMGAHMRLAMAAWARGGYLDGNPERLRRLAGVDAQDWPAIWEALGELWTRADDGRIYHARTLAELERAREKKASYQARGKLGGRPARAEGKLVEKLAESSAFAEGVAGGKTPPPPPDPSPDPENSPSARDPSNTEPVVHHGGRVTGQQLLALFGQVRNRVFPETLPWDTARDSKGDAESFARLLGPDKIPDIEASMQLALEHIRDGAEGWKDERNRRNVSFAFGSWKSGFHSLREEIHGRAPGAKEPARPAGRGVGGLGQGSLARIEELKKQGARQ